MADETVVVGTVVPLTEAAKVAAKYWWIMLVAGLASLAFGIWLVTKPVKGAHTIAVVVGLYLLVVGIVDLVHAGSARNRSAAIVAGIIVIVLGLILVLKPDVSVKVVAILWGIGFLLGGLIRIVVAIADRGYGWGWRLLLGLLGLGLGLAIVVWPTATAGVVFFIVGISAILDGLLWVVMSFSLRKAPERVAAAGGDDVAIIF